jgi:long-chain acyl-CoA synthetase
MNRAQPFLDWAFSQPDKPAVRTRDAVYTYAELAAGIRGAASRLQEHVRRGARVGLQVRNSPQFLAYQNAVFYLGGAVAPLNTGLSAPEVATTVEKLGLDVLVTDVDADQQTPVPTVRLAGTWDVPAEQIDAGPVDQAPADPALILQTSGSTGVPKGVVLTVANLRSNYDPSYRWIGVGRDDVILQALPLFNTFGLNQGINMLAMTGGTMCLLERFSVEEVARVCEQEGASFFPAVPTFISRLRAAGVRFDNEMKICVGAAPTAAAVAADTLAVFPNAELVLGYGLTEGTALTALNHVGRADLADVALDTVGPPVPGVEVRIDQTPGEQEGVGEILVRGGGVMTQYVGTEEPVPVEDGWLRTGDLGRLRGGHLVIVDRIKDLIIRGGQNIHPGDVERALHEHDDVLEVAVVGIPHPDLGEVPVAAVVLRPGVQGTTGEMLLQWLRSRIAHFKVPVRIDVLSELPKGPTGKILKPAIRRML